MVICKYFLSGNCRFGTKCVNEHLDVKQLLKSDVESAVNGNQWPLSCFGPFKEKPSIPNFIEDQSFEEIRMLCYGAKKQNFFENFNQQFTKEVIEAKNKMKMLLSLNKDVMDIVLNLYNTPEPLKVGNQQNVNPFGLGAAPNPQQNTNLFGTPAATQGSIFTGAAGSPFGGSNATPGGGIFGGAQKSVIGQSAFSSFAGQQQPQQQQNAGLFGPATPQQPQQPQQGNAFGGNIFAQASAQTPIGGGSIFGGAQQQALQQPKPQPFGIANNASVFGQQPSSGNIFAQAAQQTQQPAVGGGNIFAQAAQQTQPPAFGMFSSPTQQAPPAFGAQMTQQSPFGTVQQQPQQQKGFFGQTQQQQQMQQQQQQPNTGNIFASQMQPQQQYQPQPQQQQQAPSGLFAAAAATSPFGVQPQQQQQQPNIFSQAAAGYPQQQPQQPTIGGERTYSKMENLTPEEIEAFKANTFELGKIPFSPPPRELVNL